MWRLRDDDSQPVITAAEQIHSAHRMCHLKLPQTAILVAISMLLTILAGAIPSRMAAKKDPVVALRTE